MRPVGCLEAGAEGVAMDFLGIRSVHAQKKRNPLRLIARMGIGIKLRFCGVFRLQVLLIVFINAAQPAFDKWSKSW